jgi:putative MATE family efflux protein
MKDLTKGNIYKTFILFAIPLVLSSLLSQAYSTIDVIMAGKLLGDDALAATGAINPFSTFINSVFWGYAMGVGVYLSHLFGAKNFEKIKQVTVNNLTMYSSVMLAISLLFVVFRHTIYDFLNVDPQIVEECNSYFVVITLGKVFIMFGTFCVFVCHAFGDSTFPLAMSSLSAVLNILSSAACVVLLGTGVEGLAYGSVFGGMVVTVLYIRKLRSVFRKMDVAGVKAPFRLGVIRETGKYALPTMLQQSVMYFAGLILSPMVNSLGSAASASYSVTLRIHDLNANIYINSSGTLGNYVAQCYGAKKYHLLKKGIRVGLLQSALLVLPVILASSLFAPQAANLFYGADANPVSVGYTVNFLRYCLPFLGIAMVANLFHNFFRGMGRMKALLIMTIAGAGIRILVSSLLIGRYGIYGYYAGWMCSWLLDAAVGLGLYFFGNWKKQLPQ